MAEDINQGLLGVAESDYHELTLSPELGWLRERLGKFVRGGSYLLAGQPGIGKSTLGIQVALDLGRLGERTAYVLTEQSKEDLKRRALQIAGAWRATDRDNALRNISPDDSLYDIEALPSFLTHQVTSTSGRHHGVKLIIIDSVQGQGLSAAATKKYRQVYEFCKSCKANGITTLLVAHVTKRGEIAGPKDLEHNVDCVLVMRKAMRYRPLFVPKNRFGPAQLKPIPLEMVATSAALALSPHSQSVSSNARTYLGAAGGLAEVQAAVSLPAYGTRGRITAPGLPRKEIEQLTTCINQLPEMEIEDLDYTIQCRLPGERRYRGVVGLPLCMALIASYIQRDVPAHHIYLGEIDLLRNVRELPDALVLDLVEALQSDQIRKPVRIFCSLQAAELLREIPDAVTVISCSRLDDAVRFTWPEIYGGGEATQDDSQRRGARAASRH